jgi:membrane protein YdbS with pleckstrin-like domain
MTNDSPVLLRAKFNPLIKPYLVLYVGMIMVFTVVLIPLALIWFCGVGQWWARHYFEKLECEMNATALRFRKGIIFQTEKTIPLENIQDVTFIEGPLLKHFHLSVLKFETAGQSAGQAHDMQLIGIIDAHDFRTEILQRRESAKRAMSSQHPAPDTAGQNEQVVLLKAIHSKLEEIAVALKQK